MPTYRLSAAGRRLNLALLVGALAIWSFALWSFSSTLGIQYTPRLFVASTQAAFSAGLTVGRLVPALLMLVLIIATPVLIWNLIVEWSLSYTPSETGLRVSAPGVDLHYPWEQVIALRTLDDDRDEPVDELVLAVDPTAQIPQPLLRLLYRQSFGRDHLPIHPHLAERDALIATIRAHLGAPSPAPAADAAAESVA
jgi:hypothetical protein